MDSGTINVNPGADILFNSVAGGEATLGSQMLFALELILKSAPLWLPIILGIGFWYLWRAYVQMKFNAEQEYVLLDIKIPTELEKGPAGMEQALASLNIGSGETTFVDRMWLGKSRPWFSLELVSFGGEIHFYVWTRKGWQVQVERMLYAQFPTIEIVPAEDYAQKLDFTFDRYGAFAMDMTLSKANPYPIKTYKDFELSGGADQQGQTDPLAGILEALGSMGPGEQLWIQIIIRMHKKMPKPGTFIQQWSIVDEGSAEIKKIRSNPEELEILPPTGDNTKPQERRKLSQGQIEDIKDISNKINNHFAFDTGIRWIYLAEKERFNGINIPATVNLWKQFSAPGYNGFVPNGNRFSAKFNYPWEDYMDVRAHKEVYRALDAYRLRSWFFPPYKYKWYVLSGEELATLWHFPGNAVQTPTMPRIPSRREQAPSDLPV